MGFKLLFQFEIQKENMEEQIENFFEQNEVDDDSRTYILDLVNGIKNSLENIDKTIETHLKGWTMSRISKVDLSILRLAIFEMINRDDIPASVSINEAVEMAKKYGGEESGAFINGVLGKFIKAHTTGLEK
jgi:N utilization substance protein B